MPNGITRAKQGVVKCWMGSPPKHCDICAGEITSSFVDGATNLGPWGIMCLPCHRRAGRGLGTGRGQQYNYDSQTNRWVKVNG